MLISWFRVFCCNISLLCLIIDQSIVDKIIRPIGHQCVSVQVKINNSNEISVRKFPNKYIYIYISVETNSISYPIKYFSNYQNNTEYLG